MANERPAPQSDIKQLISKGLEQGYLTYAEVNDHLPDDIVDPEQIEDIIGMINGMGIEVHEVAPDAETLLLADGVPADKLYPLDLDRAFKKLDEIKPHITVWWTSGAQSAQLLNDGEVDMVMAWNGRVSALTKEGAKVAFTYNQGILQSTTSG